VERSLFEAIEETGEEPPLATALVNIFEWAFDFTADTRSGDRFRILVEKRHAGDAFVQSPPQPHLRRRVCLRPARTADRPGR